MEEKPCGLISVIPPVLQEEWETGLAAFTKRFRPAALILRSPDPAAAARIVATADALDLAILFADDVDAARQAAASGVFFSTTGADVAKSRAVLGSASILGAACGLSRHEAMESAEAGADFVAFDASSPGTWEKSAELSSWWDEITGISGALVLGTARPDRSVLLTARPDFLLIEETDRAAESLTFAIEFGLQSQI